MLHRMGGISRTFVYKQTYWMGSMFGMNGESATSPTKNGGEDMGLIAKTPISSDS